MKKYQPSVLFIGNFMRHGNGVSAVTFDLAEKLQSRGYFVNTASKIDNKVLRLFDMIFTTLVYFRRADIAVVDVFSGGAFIWSYIIGNLLHLLRKPFVLVLRGGNLPQYAEKHPLRVSSLFQKAQCAVSPSFYIRENMAKYRKDIIVIPNPLSMNKYDFVKRNQVQLKLIWLRSFHEIYNPPLAIHVMKRLVNEFPEMMLIMIGADKGDGSFQETANLAKKLGIENHIAFPGAVPKSQVPAWLQKGNIFINTTNIDNTPVSVMEAMACGLCVVSTNVGGLPYLLENEVDALLVPLDDPDAMANAVRRILTEPELAEHLSSNARRKVEQYDWSVVLPQWETLFQELIARG